MQKIFLIILAAGVLVLVAGRLYAGDMQLEIIPRGKIIFEAHCTACHGIGGHGDGPSAHALIPKPNDFTDPAVKESLTKSIIVDVIANGKPGTQMEGWKDKLSSADIQEVMEYIQALR